MTNVPDNEYVNLTAISNVLVNGGHVSLAAIGNVSVSLWPRTYQPRSNKQCFGQKYVNMSFAQQEAVFRLISQPRAML